MSPTSNTPFSQSAGLWKALRRTACHRLRLALSLPFRPLKLRLALTNRCNSRCIMCSIWKGQDNSAPSLPGELSVEEIARMCQVNAAFFRDLTHVSLTGGEPTLRRDFVQVVEALTRALPNRSLGFNTNGFATRRVLELTDQCLAVRRKLTVMVSLDGMGMAHSRVRGMAGDIFPAVMRTIEGLLQRRDAGSNLSIQINSVLTNLNSDQLPALYEFCRERRVGFNPIYMAVGQLYQNQDAQIALEEPARARLAADLRAICARDPQIHYAETLRLLENRGRDFGCWAGRHLFLIEENGDVFPNGGCPPEFSLGNLRDFGFSLERLLAAPQARRVLSKTIGCRLCQIPCEYMTTLRHGEALAGWRKARSLRAPISGEIGD